MKPPQQVTATRLSDSRIWLVAGMCVFLVQVASSARSNQQEIDPSLEARALAIVRQTCSECHKPGGIGPFSLVDDADIAKRAKQIGEVVEKEYMPPWLPEANGAEARIAGERRLSAEQLEALREWVAAGGAKPQAAEQNPRAGNDSNDAWPLGEPDLVLTLNEPYTLPAEGSDVVRTFVFPVDLLEDQFVRAIDFRPGNPRVVHHASFSMDQTQSGRMLDGGDAEPGYASMGDIGFNLSGSWGVWSPAPLGNDVANLKLPDDVARPLPNQCDILVEVHFNLTGKPEVIQPKVALYFTKNPVRRKPVALTLGTSHIDIAPGEVNYIVRDELVLPADVQLLSLAPRAHYVCARMKVHAKFADGRQLQLLRIDDWNFNWGQEYKFASPLCLPEGTRIHMEFAYDNSAGNSRNPSHPPKRVVTGFRPIDEMGLLFLYVIPEERGADATLERQERERMMRRLQEAKAKRAGG